MKIWCGLAVVTKEYPKHCYSSALPDGKLWSGEIDNVSEYKAFVKEMKQAFPSAYINHLDHRRFLGEEVISVRITGFLAEDELFRAKEHGGIDYYASNLTELLDSILQKVKDTHG